MLAERPAARTASRIRCPVADRPITELGDPDPLQRVEPSSVKPPSDDAFHRHLRQIRRRLFERRREHAAAIRPRHPLDLHPAPRARHPPRRILQDLPRSFPPRGASSQASIPRGLVARAGGGRAVRPREFRVSSSRRASRNEVPQVERKGPRWRTRPTWVGHPAAAALESAPDAWELARRFDGNGRGDSNFTGRRRITTAPRR